MKKWIEPIERKIKLNTAMTFEELRNHGYIPIRIADRGNSNWIDIGDKTGIVRLGFTPSWPNTKETTFETRNFYLRKSKFLQEVDV